MPARTRPPYRPLPRQGAVQNILAFRFANGLFEPVWNRQFIDDVQFDVPETPVRPPARLVLRGDRCAAGRRGAPTSSRCSGRRDGVAAGADPEVARGREGEGLRRNAPAHVRGRRPGAVHRVPHLDGVAPTPTPIPTSPVASSSTTGAGRACRSSTVPASGCRRPRVLTIVFKKPALSLFERADVSTDSLDENHLTFDLGDPGSISASFLVKDRVPP